MNKILTICCTLVLLLAMSTIFVKMNISDTFHNIRNIEASYHTLLTVKALKENGSNDHYWLPSVTLGGAINHHVAWGETKPTPSGSYIYTSFYTPSFLLATAFFIITRLDINLENLSYLNTVLGCLTSIFIMLLFVKTRKIRRVNEIGVVALPAIIMTLFSTEVLLSTGMVYWAQTVYNSILAASILVLYIYLEKSNDRTSKYNIGIILFLCFLGPLVEWTGFIYNIGLMLILHFYIKDKKLAKFILIITFFSGMFLVLHYLIALGVENTVQGFISRFSVRTVNSNLVSLPYGYIKSYGLFLLIFVFVLFSFFKNERKNTVYMAVVLASLFPLIENIILYQHASQFSFDRLKFILPCSILLFFYLCRVKKQQRYLMAWLVLICSLQNIYFYKMMADKAGNWNTVHQANLKLVKEVQQQTNISCATIATNSAVRGYYNLIFNRNIYESKSLEEAFKLPRKQQCDLVYIEASGQPNDTVVLHSFSVFGDK